MIGLISINLFTGIIILLLGEKIGEKGGKRIMKRINIINLLIIGYYIKRIIIEGEERRIILREWFRGINKKVDNIIIIDKISIIMTILIITIGYIVIRYSHWYLPELRFKGYLYIFKVTMIILICSKDIINIYIGWEWVGIMSYILISYWNKSINNSKSGIKAILYNKLGDIAFVLLISSLYYHMNSSEGYLLSYNNISTSGGFGWYILIASMAKSAQYIMHPWLGDAMAGPTPVSALLHAATMVTAGIILLYRTFNYTIEEGAIIGLITIIFGGLASITQYDIKKIIAYSTCSQLGYMYSIAIYNDLPLDISLFHLYTHAFFKALLFLTAGIIIHNNNNEQDIRRLGLNIKDNQLTYHLLFFSSLSLMSFPYTSGYYSKESILFSFYSLPFLFFSILGAMFTIIYSIRLLYITYYSNLSLKPSISFPLEYYSILLFLLYGSISLGYSSSPYFLSSYSSFIPISSYIILLSSLTIILYFITPSYLSSFSQYEFLYSFFTLFNLRTHIDSFFNIIADYILSLSYLLYKSLDKGILEYLGPIGLYRILSFNSIPLFSNISKFNVVLTFLLVALLFLFFLFISPFCP